MNFIDVIKTIGWVFICIIGCVGIVGIWSKIYQVDLKNKNNFDAMIMCVCSGIVMMGFVSLILR